MRRVDLNLLRVFDAVYATGSVSAAAIQLNLTQPAVSHALNRLRLQLRDPLFLRKGQGMAPTPAAHKLVGPVRKGLRDLELAVNLVDDFDPMKAQLQFRIGANALMESALLPRVAAAVLRYAPGIGIESVRYERRTMAQALASAQLDAVIDVEVNAGSDAIHGRRLAGGALVGIARSNHPLFRRRRNITVEQYMALRHVAVSTRPQGPSFEDIVISRTLTSSRSIAVRCQLLETAFRLVLETDLVLTLATPFVEPTLLAEGLRIFRLPFETPQVGIHLYWHASSDGDHAHAWMRDTLSGALAPAPSLKGGEGRRRTPTMTRKTGGN
jgi:DNA-binding transcriptional LysR family regulator